MLLTIIHIERETHTIGDEDRQTVRGLGRLEKKWVRPLAPLSMMVAQVSEAGEQRLNDRRVRTRTGDRDSMKVNLLLRVTMGLTHYLRHRRSRSQRVTNGANPLTALVSNHVLKDR